MGLFKTLGKIAGGVGDVVKVASPLASFIPGVGPIATAALGAGGAALGKLNDRHATLGNTLGSMAGGAAIGGLGGASVDSFQKGGLSGLANTTGGLGRTGGSATGVAGNTPGGGGLLNGILDFAKKNPALLLGGAGLLNSAHQQSGADDSRNQAINLLQTDMQRRQPLFDALLKRLSEGAPPAQTFGYHDPGNPYAGNYR